MSNSQSMTQLLVPSIFYPVFTTVDEYKALLSSGKHEDNFIFKIPEKMKYNKDDFILYHPVFIDNDSAELRILGTGQHLCGKHVDSCQFFRGHIIYDSYVH
jgi:hypothetical protein